MLQKIAEEQQAYQGCVQRFQSWLLSKTKELTDLMEREDPAESKLKALQVRRSRLLDVINVLSHLSCTHVRYIDLSGS